MRRAKMAATAAVAALAIGAVSAGAASAAPPSWHYCAKTLPKNTGNYSDKACSLASEAGQGKYEIFEGVGKGKSFKGSVKPDNHAIDITIPHKAELHVECGKASISGTPVAPRGVAGVRITFSKCELLEDKNCGTITTEALSGELGWLDRETGEAGVSLANEANPGSGLIVQFSCTFTGGQVAKFRANGAFIGSLAANGPFSKERTLFYTLGSYLEENEPTNPPAFEEGFVGTLQTEINSPESKGEWGPEGGYHSGIEASFPLKGEALSIY